MNDFEQATKDARAKMLSVRDAKEPREYENAMTRALRKRAEGKLPHRHASQTTGTLKKEEQPKPAKDEDCPMTDAEQFANSATQFHRVSNLRGAMDAQPEIKTGELAEQVRQYDAREPKTALEKERGHTRTTKEDRVKQQTAWKKEQERVFAKHASGGKDARNPEEERRMQHAKAAHQKATGADGEKSWKEQLKEGKNPFPQGSLGAAQLQKKQQEQSKGKDATGADAESREQVKARSEAETRAYHRERPETAPPEPKRRRYGEE